MKYLILLLLLLAATFSYAQDDRIMYDQITVNDTTEGVVLYLPDWDGLRTRVIRVQRIRTYQLTRTLKDDQWYPVGDAQLKKVRYTTLNWMDLDPSKIFPGTFLRKPEDDQ